MMIQPINRQQAVDRYRDIAARLPSASFPAESHAVEHLVELAEHIDVFVLDGFGVLNVGDEVIADVPQRLQTLKSLGKALYVLTNGATLPTRESARKYARWQLPIDAPQVVSSRDALHRAMQDYPADFRWSVIAPDASRVQELSDNASLFRPDLSEGLPAGSDTDDACAAAEGFVLLSTRHWNPAVRDALHTALQHRRRPVLVGNPDLVAPFPGHLSTEPGTIAHDLADLGLAEPLFYGKPFGNAFELVKERVQQDLPDVQASRIAMVGDTLHTDILGGAAAGWKTVLITGHGLLRGMDVEQAIVDAGIRPDYIAATT